MVNGSRCYVCAAVLARAYSARNVHPTQQITTHQIIEWIGVVGHYHLRHYGFGVAYFFIHYLVLWCWGVVVLWYFLG